MLRLDSLCDKYGRTHLESVLIKNKQWIRFITARRTMKRGIRRGATWAPRASISSICTACWMAIAEMNQKKEVIILLFKYFSKLVYAKLKHHFIYLVHLHTMYKSLQTILHTNSSVSYFISFIDFTFSPIFRNRKCNQIAFVKCLLWEVLLPTVRAHLRLIWRVETCASESRRSSVRRQHCGATY